jgi:hypothetical protein
MADALCRLATGGGFATRKLHSDANEVLFKATRPIILNGIPELAERPDLAIPRYFGLSQPYRQGPPSHHRTETGLIVVRRCPPPAASEQGSGQRRTRRTTKSVGGICRERPTADLDAIRS